MSEQPNASDAQATPVPCAKCGSTIHTTGHHEGGAPERTSDGGMSPMGHHEGGITGGTATTAKPGTAKGDMSPMGHHEGGLAGGLAGGVVKDEDTYERVPIVAGGHHEGDPASEARVRKRADARGGGQSVAPEPVPGQEDAVRRSARMPRVSESENRENVDYWQLHPTARTDLNLWPTSAINTHDLDHESIAAGGRLPLAIYVSDERAYDAVESAFLEFLAAIDIEVVAKGEPKSGSMFRYFGGWRKGSGRRRRNRGNVDIGDFAMRAFEMQVFDKQQAGIDSQEADAVAKLINSVGNTETALVQVGAVLLVKEGNSLVVRQLDQEQMILIRKRHSELATPGEILRVLDGEGDGQEWVAVAAASDLPAEDGEGDGQESVAAASDLPAEDGEGDGQESVAAASDLPAEDGEGDGQESVGVAGATDLPTTARQPNGSHRAGGRIAAEGTGGSQLNSA